MRIIDITHPPERLWIGREGENTFRPVSFECANWFSLYPNATIAAYYKPYGVSDPYPLVLTVDGTKRIWHPLLAELVKGDGELQIVLMNGDTVGTSAIIPTKVDRSLISNADHPASEAPSWAVSVVQDVTAQADRAEEAAERAEEAGGDVSPEAIADAVEDYFDEHPIDVPTDAVLYTPQTLTDVQKEQACDNIDALHVADDTDVPGGGGTFEPVDMSSGVEVFANRKWLQSGSYTEPSGWYGSNKIAVVPGMTYKVYNNPRYYYFYDENGANGTEMLTATSTSEFEFTVPDGYYFVAFFHNSANVRQMQMFRVTPTPEEEAELSVALKSDVFSLTKSNLKRTSVVELLAPLKNKNIVNFGDSIFGNFSAPEDVSTYLAAYTGAEVYNCGFGGSMMTTHWNANYALFSFHALVDAIVSGDWTAQDAAIADRSWTNPTTYPARLATLKALDFDDVDIITVAFGTNDWNSGKDIDNAQNPKDRATYCGAFRYSIEKLLTAYPHLRVFTCTPIFRTQLDENTHEPIQYSDTWENANGKTLPDFCVALRNASADYGFKCIDNYYELGFNKLNRTLYYRENDGTHPSVEGRKRIARNIADGIMSVGVGWPVQTDAVTQSWVQNQGYQTAEEVQTAIAEAAELPTGGSAGDFLRKTASGVAWETVPAAESNSFGGGA